MIGMLLSAFSLGLLLSVPPGTITVATVQRSLANGLRNALVFNIGITAGDVLYLLVIYFGLHIWLDSNRWIQLALLLFSGLWMGWMGLSAVRQQLQIEQRLDDQPCRSDWSSFFTGFVMNLVNPLTIIGWAAIAGNFFTTWSLHWPPRMPFGLFAIAVMLAGTLLWQFILILLASSIRRVMKGSWLRNLSIGGGMLMIVYGAGAWAAAVELMVLW